MIFLITAVSVLIQELASDINKSRRAFNCCSNSDADDDCDYIVGDQLQETFRRWLSPPDPSKNHNIACDAHHEGSAEWFLHGNTFSEWKRTTGSLLWIHGKRPCFFLCCFRVFNGDFGSTAGSGKTVLSYASFHSHPFGRLIFLTRSTIIEEIMRMREAGLASIGLFYFDFRDSSKQDVHGALCSLLTQLSAQSDVYCGILERLYSAHDAGSKEPSKHSLRECLKSMLTLQDQGPIFIALDAIDECPNSAGTPSPRENVLELIEWLSELHSPRLSICVTSRPEADIEAVLQPLSSHTVSLHGESGQREDIVNYIKWFINSDLKARRWRKEDKELILERLSEGADGM